MKKLRKILLMAFIVLIGAVWLGITFFNYGIKDIENMALASVAITDRINGTYAGSFSGGRWSNEVEVIIQAGEITDLKIVKDQMITRDDVWPTLKAQVLEKQTVHVDYIAGATVTCKAYLKAIENALRSTDPVS